MPIYEYRCGDCGKINEFLFKGKQDKVDVICNQCKSKNLTKIFSRSFVLSKENSVSSKQCDTCFSKAAPDGTPPCATDGVCRT